MTYGLTVNKNIMRKHAGFLMIFTHLGVHHNVFKSEACLAALGQLSLSISEKSRAQRWNIKKGLRQNKNWVQNSQSYIKFNFPDNRGNPLLSCYEI